MTRAGMKKTDRGGSARSIWPAGLLLAGDMVECIAEDAAGQLWFGTMHGTAHIDPATLGLSPVSW